MALPSIRHEYKVALADLERDHHAELTVVAARHPSETAEHLVLRVLGFCLLHRDGLVFGPGLSDGEAADLVARDGGRLTLWGECGAIEATKLRRVVQQNSDAEVHVVLGDERRRRELREGLQALPHGLKGQERVTVWRLDPELVTTLARHDGRRQRWSITRVDGHLYVDVDGESVDGEVTRHGLDGV